MEGDRNGFEASVLPHFLDLDKISELLYIVLDLGEADQGVQFLHGIRLRLLFFFLYLPRSGRLLPARRETCLRGTGRIPCKLREEIPVRPGHERRIDLTARAACARGRAGDRTSAFSCQRRHPVIERIVQQRLHLPQGIIRPAQGIRALIEPGGHVFLAVHKLIRL